MCITVKVGNLDNWSRGNPRFPMWHLSQNSSSTEPCRSESSFASLPGLANLIGSPDARGRTDQR
jgi:hypothetical protein